MRSSLADMNMHNLRRWMKGRRRTVHLGARGTFHSLRRYTFARNDLLFTMSDNTRMQTTRGRDAWHGRIHFHGRADGGAELRVKSGGARRNRTDDLLLAKQALSQLSYGPDRIRYQ